MMDDLDIHPRISAALHRAKLKDFGTVLSMSAPDLERATQLSMSDVRSLHRAIAQTVVKMAPATGLQMYRTEPTSSLHVHRLTTGCPVLDSFLRGGILSRGITELSGESASGKTQLCMQLCLTAQFPTEYGGLEAGALYVCTEDVFPNRRLMQMAQLLPRKHQDKPGVQRISYTDNIFIEHASDLDDLWFCITKKASVLLAQGRIKLVIIDSIAGLFRGEFALKDMTKRAKQMSSFAAQLHRLSHQYNIPIVCVNQISAVLKGNSGGANFNEGRKVTPALGLSWANFVTTRLMLTRTSQSITIPITEGKAELINKNYDACVRTLEVMFSPHLPNTVCHCTIDSEGFKGLS